MVANKERELKSRKKLYFSDSKPFAVFLLAMGIFGLLIVLHNAVSYENILKPHIDYLIENKIMTNDRNGATFLLFFTQQSNIFIDVYFILFAIGVLGNKWLYRLTHREGLRGAVTLYILVTGIIYCFVLMPFAPSFFPFPNEGNMWFSNVVNTWNHMIMPAFALVTWFFPVSAKPVKVVKTSLLYLIYPVAYFIFSIVNGAIIDFYPYPFLNGKQLWEYVLKDKPYNSTIGVLLLVVVVIIFSVLFFALGAALNAIHNNRAKAALKD